VLHQQLRNVEHKLCLKVWDVVHEVKCILSTII
jgi:hypothetical protein